MSERDPYAPPQAEVRDAVPDDSGELASRGARFVGAFLDTLIESIVTENGTRGGIDNLRMRAARMGFVVFGGFRHAIAALLGRRTNGALLRG